MTSTANIIIIFVFIKLYLHSIRVYAMFLGNDNTWFKFWSATVLKWPATVSRLHTSTSNFIITICSTYWCSVKWMHIENLSNSSRLNSTTTFSFGFSYISSIKLHFDVNLLFSYKSSHCGLCRQGTVHNGETII